MEKLEFDSLHKFFVSLGLIFIALPFLLLLYLFNSDIILISQTEYDTLSIYSQTQLHQHEHLITIMLKLFPWMCVILFLAGISFLVIGINNWKKVQKNLDALLDADRTKHELEAAQMKPSEVLERTVEEVKEDEEMSTPPENSLIINHMDIEDRFFTHGIPLYIKRRHYIYRNVKIGKYEYDGILVSTSNNIDIIYEIKVWKKPRSLQMLKASLERLYKAGINYETLKHRNFRCVLVIATTTDNVELMQQWVKQLLLEETESHLSQIEIKYYTDELLE